MKKKYFAIDENQMNIGIPVSQHEVTRYIKQKNEIESVTSIHENNTVITFPDNNVRVRKFNFAPYYGKGFDAITTKCQSTIRKLLTSSIATNQASLAVSTIVGYCRVGLKYFFEFLTLYRSGSGMVLEIEDITPELIDMYITHIKSLDIGMTTQRNIYKSTKPVLIAAHCQGHLSHLDIKQLFPINPFPNSSRHEKGERPLSQHEKKQIVCALKIEMTRMLACNDLLDSFDLTVCVLGIALVTGMNPTPLLSLPNDCIQPHPLKKNLRLLVAFKRRGSSTQVLSLRQSKDIELIRSVKLQAATTIEMIIERNISIREEYKDPSRLLVYASNESKNKGNPVGLSRNTLAYNINLLKDKHHIVDDDGKPLKLNIMRLRKTFINRMWELSGQDPLIAARLGKHNPKNANRHYWEAPREAETNMRFIGEARIEGLRVSYGHKENTAVASCKDTRNGHRAPKDGSICTETLSCFRCKSFVVTENDLYRLFSFYWAVVRERNSYGVKNWNKYLRHIVRIIDEDITPQFDIELSAILREKARTKPHPFWRDLTMLRMAR